MRFIVPVFACLLLAGCATITSPQHQKTAEIIDNTALSAKPVGKLYQVDPISSELRIVTYPQGRFGHAHVIGGDVLNGQIVLPDNHHQVWFDINIEVADLKVDKAEWRKDENLDPDMTEDAIMGTRANMLSNKVLNADVYSQIRIQAKQASGPFWQPDITAAVSMAGTTQTVTIPVSVQQTKNALEITGQLPILQTDFGIEPFTALGGILGVADKVLIRFRIHAVAQ